MGKRKRNNADKTREALLDAAEIIFMKKGVVTATLEEIAAKAKMTRGAFYWHFKNKADIFDAMHQRVKLPMEEFMEKTSKTIGPLNALKETAIFCLRNLSRNEHARRVYTILFYKCEDCELMKKNILRQNERRDKVIKRLTGIFTKAQEEGKLKDNISPNTAAIAFHAYINGIFRDYLRRPEPFNLHALAPQLIETFFSSMVK